MSVVANVAINIDGKQAESLLKSIQSEVEKLNGSFGKLEKPAQGFGASIKAAAGSVIGQLAAVTGAAFTLQQAFNTLAEQSRAEAALRSLGVNADVASAQFVKLSQDLQGQASSVELTAAAYDVASAGFLNVAEQTQILEASTKGAVGGMSDLNTVGNAVTSVLNAYGMSADQANKLVDGFIQTQNDGKIVLAEYATQIGRLAPTAAAAGVGIDELNAAVSTITAQGVPVEATFTGLNQALVSILKPTKEAEGLARSLGIEFNETGLRTQGFGGLLAQVAQATGGSTTQLTKLFGSVDALKAVLPLVNDGLVGFNKNLENQEKSTGVADRAFKEMSDTLQGAIKQLQSSFVALVVAFKPVTPAIIAPFKLLAGTLNLVAQNIKGVAMAATFLGTFAGILNASAIATKAWAIATAGLAAAKKAAGVAAAFLQGVMNPASLATTALALGTATAAAVTLGNAMGDAGIKAEEAKLKQSGVAGATAAVKDEAAKLTEETNKQAAALDQLPPRIEDAKEKTKQLKEAQDAVTKAIEESGRAIDANATASQAIADQQSSVTQAYLKAEMQINDVLLDQLNRQLDGARTQAERIAIARDIYKLTVQQANLEYEATKAQIAAEVEKAHLALMATEQKAKEVQLIVELATAQGHVNESHYKSLQLAHESVNLASVQAGTTQLIATQQERAAKAVLQGKINAAGAAFQTNILAKNTNDAANQSERFAAGFQKAAAAVSGMSQNALTKRIYGSTTTTTTRANATPAVASSSASYIQSSSAMDGGSGSEYAIPASKMQNAMKRYADDGRGSSTMPFTVSPQVNVTTGPVMNMNGQNYVSQRDLMSGLMSASRSTAESVIDMLRSDMSVRREIGLS